MKAKIFMGIIIGCLTVALVGLLVSQRVQAQETAGHGGLPEGVLDLMWVKFAEDHMRQHGKQIKSWCVELTPTGQWFFIDTVPSGKRFIITDITSIYSSGIWLAVDETGAASSRKAMMYIQEGDDNSFSYQSGIEFDANESIYAYSHNLSTWVTISGYYVDLP